MSHTISDTNRQTDVAHLWTKTDVTHTEGCEQTDRRHTHSDMDRQTDSTKADEQHTKTKQPES